MGPARTIVCVSGEPPVGEMPLAPECLTGRSQSELAHDMAGCLQAAMPESGADALRRLRAAFPNASLSARVAALAAMVRP
jgi:hypothetical protein